jgi:ribonuclease Z
MRANLSVDLHPPRPPAQNLDAEKSDIFHPAVSSNSFLDLPELTRTRFMEAQAAVQSDSGPQLEGMPGKDVMICPLGTGSAMPSKFRNGNV